MTINVTIVTTLRHRPDGRFTGAEAAEIRSKFRELGVAINTIGQRLAAMGDGSLLYFDSADDDKLYIFIDGSSKVVSVGADDSGGTGYKLLRVPNA